MKLTQLPPPSLRPQRVVVLDPSTAPTGALQAAINIANGVVDSQGAGIETVLVLPASSKVIDVDLSMFTHVVRVPMRQIRRAAADLVLYTPTLLVAAIRLRRMLRDDDVLVVNDIYLLHGWMVRRLGFRGRIVTWVRIDPLSFPMTLRRVWIAAMRDASDAVAAVSSFIARRLRDEGITARLIYDPVDPALTPTRALARPTFRDGTQTIVQIANFTRGKGQDDAITAFARIAARFPKAQLVLYGGILGLQRNRDYLAGLKRQADATGFSDRIAFHDFTRNVIGVLANADVALVLSHRESFSLACLEASQAGLPVVATRCGGPEEIVADGETGVMCGVGDVAKIAEAMAQLLADQPAAAAMGARGAALVEKRFSREIFTNSLSALLFLKI